ncbi:hypothetical protein [Actinoplanes solisilvae]|uniref:hypothetical protein n=1 Tax=Actinoplanes solisilvae TaxID=2486853 RepID=UPI000FD89194|nr:hypothetical protein [Actinoplanes solisilvae]
MTLLRVRREAALDAAGRLDAAMAGQAAAATKLRRAGADRSLPVERLDSTAAALDRFGGRLSLPLLLLPCRPALLTGSKQVPGGPTLSGRAPAACANRRDDAY